MEATETLQEIWKDIPDLPGYSVSNFGHVMNNKTEKLVKPQITPQGVVYVPLFDAGWKGTRSVKVLVAKAFVEGETDIFDTPINKDGDKKNNHVENLLWRPRWFAIKYTRQFDDEYPHRFVGPVFDNDTGEEYEHIYAAATHNGLLFREVFIATVTGNAVRPTNQRFSIPDSIQVR